MCVEWSVFSDVLVSSQETEEATTETAAFVPVHCSSSPRGMEQDSGPSEPEGHTRPPQFPVPPPTCQSNPFSSLSLSVPNGLLLQFLQEEPGGR